MSNEGARSKVQDDYLRGASIENIVLRWTRVHMRAVQKLFKIRVASMFKSMQLSTPLSFLLSVITAAR
jgi:hypothetical protein